MERLRSIRIQRFKRIADAPIDLEGVNVLVGGNNSGKSSIIQGLHFAVGLLQTIALVGDWDAAESTSLNPNQLIYSPSEDVYALAPGGRLLEPTEKAINFELTLVSGKACSVSVRKGRNRNILVAVNRPKVGETLSHLKNPFSVFSPGLAGISKRETYVSDGVLFRTLARGDANLVLRNILLRLSMQKEWGAFLDDLRDVFPKLDINVDFDMETSELINVEIKTADEWVPLEIAGTGVLQATQILSYIHRFDPAIIVLDEPDSHLHPNNQRLLCALLKKVAEERGTQVLLTTHSRHIVDALSAGSKLLWVRNGDVQVASRDDEVGILLDIGALDVNERAGQPDTDAVVLTEDEIVKPLETVLESSGFDLSRTAVLRYYGISVLRQLRPLISMIRKTNSKAKLIVHRDRDFLTDDEVENWEVNVRKLGAEPFITDGRDIESQFIRAAYLHEANPEISVKEFDEMIAAVADKSKLSLQSDYVNGRIEILKKRGETINAGAIAAEAAQAISSHARRYYGKPVLRAVRSEFQSRLKSNMNVFQKSDYLRNDLLNSIAKKAFKRTE